VLESKLLEQVGLAARVWTARCRAAGREPGRARHRPHRRRDRPPGLDRRPGGRRSLPRHDRDRGLPRVL